MKKIISLAAWQKQLMSRKFDFNELVAESHLSSSITRRIIFYMLLPVITVSCTTSQLYTNSTTIEHRQNGQARQEEVQQLREISERDAIEQQKIDEATALEEKLRIEKEERERHEAETKEQLRLQQAYIDAIKFNDLKTVSILCTDQSYADACDYLKEKCRQKKDGEACFHVATEAVKNFPNEKMRAKAALKFVDLACKYKYKEACDSRDEFKRAEREEFSEYRDEQIKENVKCGKSQDDIISYYGVPEASWECDNKNYTSINYGRTWVHFKAGKSFLIQDHSEYKNACEIKSAYFFKRESELKGKWLCGG